MGTENEKPGLRLVSCNPNPVCSGKAYFRCAYPVPDCDRGIVGRLKEYTGALMAEVENDFLNHCGSEKPPEDGVLGAIYCLSPSRAQELAKELNIISALSASGRISHAAKSKLSEADYFI